MLHDIWQGSAMPPRVSLLVPALCQLFTSLSTVLPTTHAGAQELPGTRPKEELAVELMQARTYCRGVEIQLEKIRKKYPALKMQVLVAETSWKASPFFGGGKAIEKDMRAQAGKAARTTRRTLHGLGPSHYMLERFSSSLSAAISFVASG